MNQADTIDWAYLERRATTEGTAQALAEMRREAFVYRISDTPQRRRERGGSAVESLLPVHEAQLLTYLKTGGWTVRLLINFNVPVLKQGIRRRVLGLKEKRQELSAPSASLR